jgi:prepilin-type N-terminal cleavage/methylation domain-containing protein
VKRGFTIVELIIVITVIGILAAISLVSYSSVISRAHNSKIIAGVRIYLDQINVYHAQNGYWPTTGPEDAGQHISVVCLGTGYASSACGTVSGVNVFQDTVFNLKMVSYVGSNPPALNDQSLASGPEAFVGAVYGNDGTTLLPGYTYARTIQYALNGANADCQISGAVSYRLTTNPDVTACEIDLEAIY